MGWVMQRGGDLWGEGEVANVKSETGFFHSKRGARNDGHIQPKPTKRIQPFTHTTKGQNRPPALPLRPQKTFERENTPTTAGIKRTHSKGKGMPQFPRPRKRDQRQDSGSAPPKTQSKNRKNLP